jgi:hypothetical protein
MSIHGKEKPNMTLSKTALAVAAATSIFVLGAVSASSTAKPQSNISVVQPDDKVTEFKIKLPAHLSETQVRILTLAYQIAKQDGHKYPYLLQGIVLQETNAGEVKKYKVAGHEHGLHPNNRYYGVAQIKLKAARDVLASYPSLISRFNFHTNTDEEVIAKLIENEAFNLEVASKYLLIMKRYGFITPREMALAYNQGPGGAKNQDPETFYYPNGVMKHIQSLKRV